MTVTVLMPAYNSEDYIAETIESILKQSYEDFELLIINDGSTDTTAEIIKSFSDERICFLENEKNNGIVKTLNRGLALINTKYTIRIDSDDVMERNRLEYQIKFMDKHAKIGMMGTQSLFFNDDYSIKYKTHLPLSSKKINTYLFFNSPIIHPSVIIRTSILKNERFIYDEEFSKAEDYELWTRISKKYTIVNSSKALVKHRINKSGITQTHQRNQRSRDELIKKIYEKNFHNIDLSLNSEQLQLFRDFANINFDLKNVEKTRRLDEILFKIYMNLDNKYHSKKYFNELVGNFFINNAHKTNLSYRETLKLFEKVFNKKFKMNFINKIKLLKKKSSP